VCEGNKRRDDQVNRQEPDRDQRQLCRKLCDFWVNAKSLAEEGDHRPNQKERQNRIDQALQTPGEPCGIGSVVAWPESPSLTIGSKAEYPTGAHLARRRLRYTARRLTNAQRRPRGSRTLEGNRRSDCATQEPSAPSFRRATTVCAWLICWSCQSWLPRFAMSPFGVFDVNEVFFRAR